MTPALLLACAALIQDPDPAPLLVPFVPRFDLQEPQENLPGESTEPKPPAQRSRDRDDPLQTLVRFITHPFRDNGRRFDAYPYASEGPYYTTQKFSTKMFAFELSSTFGYVDHETWSVGQETKFSWSSGCDVRMDFLVFEEVIDGHRFETQVGHIHLDIGGIEGPRTVDWSVGFGIGSMDDDGTNFDEEISGFAPSVRAGLRAFPFRPWSFRLDAVYTWFDHRLVDLRGDVGLHFGPLAVIAGVRAVLLSGADDLVGPTVGVAWFF